MTIIIIFLAAAAVFYFFLSRGRKAVRAFFYMLARHRGEGVSDANRSARMIGFRRASQHNLAMIDYANAHFNGSQLKLIGAARRDGFLG
jgi:hypothetical protein